MSTTTPTTAPTAAPDDPTVPTATAPDRSPQRPAPAEPQPPHGIPQLRAAIDGIDESIAALVLRRRGLSRQIQALRMEASQGRRCVERERQVFDAYLARMGRRGIDVAHAVLRYCLADTVGRPST